MKKTKICGTCNIIKPFRSHHCADCENCVERFDHHCPWLGNCVARRNYKFYYVFITFLNLLCVGSIILAVLHIVYSTRKYFELYPTLDDNKKIPNALVNSDGSCIISIFVIILNFFMMIFVTGLFVYHTILVCVNLTTKEELKKSFKRPVGNPYNRSLMSNINKICCPKLPKKSLNKILIKPYKVDSLSQNVEIAESKGKIIKPNFNRQKVEEIYKDFNYYDKKIFNENSAQLGNSAEEVDDTNYRKDDHTTDRNKKNLSSEEKEHLTGRDEFISQMSHLSHVSQTNFSNRNFGIKRTKSRLYEVNAVQVNQEDEEIQEKSNAPVGLDSPEVNKTFNWNLSINEEDVSREKTIKLTYISNHHLSDPRFSKNVIKETLRGQENKNFRDKVISARNVEEHNQNLNQSISSKTFFKKYTFN
jgi:hypothetical protein